VRISPLEDTYVALRPIIPYLPFDIPNSVRELNPMMPDGEEIAPGLLFTPQGQPTSVVNHLVNFGWEYVFHCHILSHEEMDMMHPVLVAVPPVAPGNLTFDPGTMTLSWSDESLSETAFIVEKLANGVWTAIYTLDRPLDMTNTIGDVLTYTDATFVAGDQYRVFAENVVGDTLSTGFPVVTTKSSYVYYTDATPSTPSGLMATSITSAQVDLAWTDNAINEDGFVVERSDDLGVTWNQIGLPTAADVTTFSDTSVLPLSTYQCQVYASNASGNSAPSNVLDVSTPDVPPAAPSNLVITNQTASSLTLAWTDNSNDESGFTVQIATDKNFSQSLQSINVGADVTVYMFFPLAPNTKYYMRVAAFNGAGSSAWSPTLIDKLVKCCIIFTWPNAHFN
ncbi:MAG: fibronectin type III domain-containing protein, partial [Anaerolineae bacterium]